MSPRHLWKWSWRIQRQNGFAHRDVDCDWLARRALRKRVIDAKAERGLIAMVHGGQDCDGGRWDNCVTYLPATTMHTIAWENAELEWADGPRWFHLARPSEGRRIEDDACACA